MIGSSRTIELCIITSIKQKQDTENARGFHCINLWQKNLWNRYFDMFVKYIETQKIFNRKG